MCLAKTAPGLEQDPIKPRARCLNVPFIPEKDWNGSRPHKAADANPRRLG
jgi:hypothetical protein